MAFLSAVKGAKEQKGRCTYYPIQSKPKTPLQKLAYYYGGYKHINEEAFVNEIQAVIADFRPDVIHLFGLECPLATILGHTVVPLIVHLQGLLLPNANAFWPIGMNDNTFARPFTLREHLVRNGYRFAKRHIDVRAENERKLFRRMQICMGRTQWDYEVAQLLQPTARYFHVDEVLRPIFYEQAAHWRKPRGKRFVITSTISQTIYKGLDLVLKTAALLEAETDVDFEWRVVGVNASSNYVRFFESYTHIHSPRVKYMGVMTAEALAENLLESNVYVHPSYIDNSPNSVCEAQIIGVPVVATNVGGVGSLIEHGKSGLLVPANAPFEMAYNLWQLVHDNELLEALSRNGATIAAVRHDRKKILEELLHAYREAIAPTSK